MEKNRNWKWIWCLQASKMDVLNFRKDSLKMCEDYFQWKPDFDFDNSNGVLVNSGAVFEITDPWDYLPILMFCSIFNVHSISPSSRHFTHGERLEEEENVIIFVINDSKITTLIVFSILRTNSLSQI